MKNRLTSIVIVCFLIIGGFLGFITFESKVASAYTPHDLIYIDSNLDFADFDDDGVINPGALGTESDPYIIEGWEINASTDHGIVIKNTNVYFIIRNCWIYKGGPNMFEGIYLSNVINGRVESSNITNNYYGIYLNSSSGNTISNNSFSNNVGGIGLLQSSSLNTISNNSINSGNGSGILISSGSGNTISNNSIYSNGLGIRLALSFNNTISNNSIYSNFGYGIEFYSSSSNTISNNSISHNSRGILLYMSSSLNTISNNSIYSNVIDGIAISRGQNNDISNNDIYSNGFRGIDLGSSSIGNVSDNIISNNNIYSNQLDGVAITYESQNNTVSDNNIHSNDNGIWFFKSNNNNMISNNSILNNNDGISFWESLNSTISDNIIYSNNDDGIYLWKSLNTTISNNSISNNDDGIDIYDHSDGNMIIYNNISGNINYGINIVTSDYNRIHHNTFAYNNEATDTFDPIHVQAYDDSINYWNDSYPSGGNYWYDYDGIDLNSTPSQDVPPPDGIGDTPYIIDLNSWDYYPFMISWGNGTFLYEGWNLVSIPFIQSDTNLGAVLSSISGSYDAVQWYNTTDISDHWKHNHTGKPQSFNDLNEIDHTMGFWIHITKPGGVLLEYHGTRPTVNQTITLHPGWNHVGYPSLTIYNRTTGLNNIDDRIDIDAIQWFDASNQTWHFLEREDYFELGRGYWIHSKVEKDWIVPL